MRSLAVFLAVQCLLTAASAQSNLVRNAKEKNGIMNWVPSKNVSIELSTAHAHSGKTSIQVAWQDVREMREWARAGNLLRSKGSVLTVPLKRDTRYRFRCWVFVQNFQITPESRAWLSEYPEGMYDRPTVTIGGQGGAWNSGMPLAAYDMSEPRTWQELSFEFVTPFNLGGRRVPVLRDHRCRQRPQPAAPPGRQEPRVTGASPRQDRVSVGIVPTRR